MNVMASEITGNSFFVKAPHHTCFFKELHRWVIRGFSSQRTSSVERVSTSYGVIMWMPSSQYHNNDLPIYSAWCGTPWTHLWGWPCYSGFHDRSSWVPVCWSACRIPHHAGSRRPAQGPSTPLKKPSTVLFLSLRSSGLPEMTRIII